MAGWDPSGKAGLIVDIFSAAAFPIPFVPLPTAFTIQTKSRFQVTPRAVGTLRLELQSAFQEYRIGGIKIGLVPSPNLYEVIVQSLSELAPAGKIPVVVDPVLRSSLPVHDNRLVEPTLPKSLPEILTPLRPVLTPNIPELEELTGRTIRSLGDIRESAKQLIAKTDGPVLVKGGHLSGKTVSDHLFLPDGLEKHWRSPRLAFPRENPPRGTGCRFSTALAAHLASGYPLETAVSKARSYVRRYLCDYWRRSNSKK